MKKLKLFLPALLLGLFANSQLQQIKIVSFTVKNQLPATIDNWTSIPGALIMVAQKVPNPRMVEPRLVIQIRSGGAVICGNNAATAKQVDPFDVRTFSTADLTGFLTGCHDLKEGTYTICAQFFNVDRIAISNEVCKEFRVEATNIEYAPPTLITPDNGKKFTVQELMGVVMFRWTPLVPKPKEPVTYRIKVWQLMEGQTGAQAMRSNQPIVSKDVDNLTQTTANGLYTGPCKPPYLCDFIWNVQALNHSGKPMGNNNGTSEPYTFSAAEEKTTGPNNVFPENNKKFNSTEAGREIVFRWTALVPKPSTPVTYRIKVWQLMEGQNGTTAMRSNQPIVSKDVDNITQAAVSGIYTGPCKPPYLCDFIWNVQVVTRDGTPGATSEPTTFNISGESTKCSANLFPEDKKKFTTEEAKREMIFRWTPNGPPPGSGHYRIKVWQLMQGQNGTQAMRTNQPIVTKDVDNLTQVTVSGIYTGPCKPPYLCDFIWAVEFMGAAGQAGCTSEPTTFSVSEEKTKGPDNVFPENNKKFNSTEAGKEIVFRWTTLVPKPKEPVTYRIKVWQLMEGQNGTQAMRSNPPLATKDVTDIGQAAVNNLYTGPCKPPYLCDFIWNVQAITRDGTPGATSEPTMFSVTEVKTKGPDNLLPEDKKIFTLAEVKSSVTFKWKPISPAPAQPLTYHVRVWPLMKGQTVSDAILTVRPILDVDGNGQVDALTDGMLLIRYLETGPCKPPYLCDFVWNVQAKTREGRVVGTSEPTVFTVKDETVKCPANTFPEDKKRLSSDEAKRSITFKWTKPETPGESSAYRIKVWQLMDGQNGSQAMKSNTPIVTKEVRNATEVTVDGLYTGPCKPPYLCDFIWAVEKINASGHVTCSSEPTMFFVTQYIIQLDSIKVSCTAKPGVYSFKYCITNPNAGTAKLITFTATSSTPAGASISTFSPPLNTTINSNGQLCITGTITAATNLSNICIGAAIQDVANNFWQAQRDTCVIVLPCKCDVCDSVKIDVKPKGEITFDAAGNIVQNSTISVSPKLVKSIKAELVYFEYKPESDDCMLCNKDSKTFGNFSNGTHSQEWNFAPPKNLSSGAPLSMIITVPPTVKCCDATIKWCIRYVVTFEDCTVCNKLICYEKKKEGCSKTGGGDNNGLPK